MSKQVAEDLTQPWSQGPYSAKRHGTTLETCDSEPVSTPGCIQAHGAMLVLRKSDLKILQASENTLEFLGVAAEELLSHPVGRVVGPTREALLRNMLKHKALEHNVTYAFTLQECANGAALDVCVHTIDGVVVVEFESTGRVESHHEDDFFMMVKAAVGRLQTSNSVRVFCQQVTEEIRAITGIDRVMAYRFHADQHGEVIAESKDDALVPWLGLHYPATDIPQPTREIFKRLWIRPVPNAASPLVELLPLANPDTGKALDMTYCALRGASVMYTEYLANMGAAASLTMPIMRDNVLWGLIACQHNSPTHFPYQIRAACELLAQVASMQLRTAEYAEQLEYRLKMEEIHQQLTIQSSREGDLLALTAYQPSLLDAINAGGVALYHLNRWWCIGNVPELAHLDTLANWLYEQPEFESTTRPIFVTDVLASLCPAAVGLENVASGILATIFSRDRRGLVIWFRPETMQTVNWAGNPDTKPMTTGLHGTRLTPRVSFELFIESVRGRSLPWLEIEIDVALRLRLLILELVITRGERLIELNADLTRSNEELDAFAYVASHDLKEPLRGIHRYAHQLLENTKSVDGENQQRVNNLMRLTVRMDNLLDSLLHYSRVGRMELDFEESDLNTVVDEAIEMIGARRQNSQCSIEIPRLLPKFYCDPLWAREIYTNLLNNSQKYKRHILATIEIGYIAADEQIACPSAPAEAIGKTIFYVKDDGIGIESRHYELVFSLFKRMHGRDEYGGGVGAGLTIAQKLVQRHGGQIWLDSKMGVGTTFYFTLSGLSASKY
jgi:chemotaxis family two-component system sensor kinase Cph1